MNKYTRYIWVAAVLLIVITGSVEGAPRLKVETSTWDFDVVDEGDTLTHTFKITNKGTEKLIIDQNIICDRPYLKADLDKYELDVDDEARLTVTLSTDGLGNRRIQAFVYLSTNDKNAAFTILAKIKPKPVPIIHVSPRKYDFGSMEQGRRKTNVFKYANVGEGMLTIKDIVYVDGQFEIVRNVSQKELESNDEGDFVIGFTAKSEGYKKGFLLLESNSSSDAGTLTKVELEAVVVRRVRGVVLEPPRPMRRSQDQPKDAPQYFKIGIKNNNPYEILITSGDKSDTATIGPNGRGSIKSLLIRDENAERIKLELDFILRKKQPPKKEEPAIE